MWNWFKCYLSGRHDFGAWCEAGAMFLRCANCGKRSSGWAIDAKATPPLTALHAHVAHEHAHIATPPHSRVVPFSRAAAR